MISTPTDAGLTALRELRQARRKRRLIDLHWVDTMYRLYVLIVVLGAGLLWLGTILGRSVPSVAGAARINRDAVWVTALIFGIALLAAVRSGSRGGPLASEGADVVHVLSAPLDRGMVLRRPLLAVLRRGALVGGAVGTLAGEILASSMPGSRLSWLFRGLLIGAVLGLLWMSVAIACAGRVVVRRVIGIAIVVAVGLAAVDGVVSRSASHRILTSPLSVVAWMGLIGQPVSTLKLSTPTLWSIVIGGLLLLMGLVGAVFMAIRGLADVDMERSAQRARLVGQLRFAVSTQDLRTVLLLRRQLSNEAPRRRPWFTIRQPKRTGLTWAVLVRTIRGIGRWPLTRFVRIIVLGLLSSAAAVSGWRGSPALFVVCGLLAFVAGLDVVEGIGQHIDHPYIAAGMPRHRGRVMNRQLIGPILALIVLGLPGAAVGAAFEWHRGLGAASAVVLLLCWAAGGAVGGAVSTVMGPPDFALSVQTPEVAFMLTAAPALLSVLSIAGPLFSAHLALKSGGTASGFTRAIPPVLLLMYIGTVVITAKGEPDWKTPPPRR
jgi:hypothetical protein